MFHHKKTIRTPKQMRSKSGCVSERAIFGWKIDFTVIANLFSANIRIKMKIISQEIAYNAPRS